MSENIKSANQRLKMLYLYKILNEETDAEHPMTMPNIISRLESYGISASRFALYEDIDALVTYGVDIIKTKGKSYGYYVASREFELSELKLLVDAVASSRFLTQKKSAELVKKLQSLASVNEAKQLHRHVHNSDRVKAFNEEILYNVDTIYRAIAEHKQIHFEYFDYDINKKKRYRKDGRICSPYVFAWDDERYYLIAYSDRHPENFTHYRVDRMEKVRILDEQSHKIPENFDIAEYMNSTFSMFSGETKDVKLRFDKSLVNVVLDRFGKGVMLIPDGDEHFTVRVKVKAEQPFLAWLFQFASRVEVLEPCEVREKFRNTLAEVLGLYNS